MGCPWIEVHVAEEGRAGRDHLADGEFVAAPDVVRGHLCLGGPDIFLDPGLQGDVVRRAAQQGHGGVGVGVVEGRKDGRPVGLDHAVGHGVLRRVEVLETVVADQDVGLAPFVQDVVEEDGLRLAEFAFEALVAIQDAGSVREENPAAGGQCNPSAAALEELAAGKLLQLGDVLADRRLRDAERLGGGGETAQLGDTLEYA